MDTAAPRTTEDIQHKKGGYLMKLRTLLLFALAALLGATAAVLPALAANPPEAKLEVNENCVELNWPCWATPGTNTPASKVTIAPNGVVKFADNATTSATVVWTGAAPTCSGVPASPMTKWEGTCTFEQPGTYKFESSTLFNDGITNYTKYEIAVENTSTSTTPPTSTTTTPSTTTTTTLTTTNQPSGLPPQAGSTALKLSSSQHGSTVRGSIEITQANSGGHIEVALFTARASLAKAGHSKQTRVGRLVRSSVKAGTVAFAVPLSANGKAALRRHHRLKLTAKITLTPLHGTTLTITRAIVMHA